MCEVDCDRSMACSVGVSDEAVVELFVDVSLNGGDLLLFSGFLAEGCSKWFELEGGVYSFVERGWFGVVLVELVAVVLN